MWIATASATSLTKTVKRNQILIINANYKSHFFNVFGCDTDHDLTNFYYICSSIKFERAVKFDFIPRNDNRNSEYNNSAKINKLKRDVRTNKHKECARSNQIKYPILHVHIALMRVVLRIKLHTAVLTFNLAVGWVEIQRPSVGNNGRISCWKFN